MTGDPVSAEQAAKENVLLSPACEEFLLDQELYAVHSILRADDAHVMTYDGLRLFTVTLAIDIRDLRMAFFKARAEYDRGLSDGRAAMAASLRLLIGAAAS